MTTEEKARAYDEAIGKAQNILHTSEFIKITDLFPNLVESEDERIRKGLISYFEIMAGDYFGEFKKSDIITYLEKQKEQKSQDYAEELKKCKENPLYFYDNYVKIKMKEQKSEWNKVTINGEPIPTENQSVDIPLAKWSEEDSDNLERVDNYLWMLDDYVGDDCAMPQGKTDKIRGNIQGVLSPWLKSLPERFNLQPKQEWSEEDRLHYANVLEALEYVKGCKSDYDKIEAVKSDIAWFKSLRPYWKPSE